MQRARLLVATVAAEVALAGAAAEAAAILAATLGPDGRLRLPEPPGHAGKPPTAFSSAPQAVTSSPFPVPPAGARPPPRFGAVTVPEPGAPRPPAFAAAAGGLPPPELLSAVAAWVQVQQAQLSAAGPGRHKTGGFQDGHSLTLQRSGNPPRE